MVFGISEIQTLVYMLNHGPMMSPCPLKGETQRVN